MANITPLSRVETPRSQQMLEWLLTWSAFFAFVERRGGFEVAATDFDLFPTSGDGSVQTRGVGEGYTRQAELPPDRVAKALGFHGDSVVMDRSHLQDDRLGLRPIGSWVPPRLRSKFRDWVKGMEALVFQGAGTQAPREMLGLSNLLDGSTNVPGYSRTMVIDAADFSAAATDSLDLSDSDQKEDFRKALEQILPNYENPGVICNRQLGSVISGIAQEQTRYQREPDEIFGMIERVFGYELVRVFDGVIPNTEPDNAGTPANNTTSLYIASPEEQRYSVATNSGLWVKDELDAEQVDEDDIASGKIEWEMRCENAIQDEYAIVRVRNLKVAAGSEVYGFFGA